MKKFVFPILLLVLLTACGTSEPEIVDNGQPGSILVVVFDDVNHNKVKDEGEKGVSADVWIVQGVTCASSIPKDGRFITKTDENGESLYSNLTPERYCVAYLGSNSTTTKLNQTVYLDSDEKAVVSFGVTLDE